MFGIYICGVNLLKLIFLPAAMIYGATYFSAAGFAYAWLFATPFLAAVAGVAVGVILFQLTIGLFTDGFFLSLYRAIQIAVPTALAVSFGYLPSVVALFFGLPALAFCVGAVIGLPILFCNPCHKGITESGYIPFESSSQVPCSPPTSYHPNTHAPPSFLDDADIDSTFAFNNSVLCDL